MTDVAAAAADTMHFPLGPGNPFLLLMMLPFVMQGMGVHGIVRLRLAETPDRDPMATEDYPYYLGDELFDGWGLGPNAASLAFRCVVSHDSGVIDAGVLCAEIRSAGIDVHG